MDAPCQQEGKARKGMPVMVPLVAAMQKEHFIILFWWHGVDVLKRVVKTLRLTTCTVVRWMAKTDLYNYSKKVGGLVMGFK